MKERENEIISTKNQLSWVLKKLTVNKHKKAPISIKMDVPVKFSTGLGVNFSPNFWRIPVRSKWNLFSVTHKRFPSSDRRQTVKWWSTFEWSLFKIPYSIFTSSSRLNRLQIFYSPLIQHRLNMLFIPTLPVKVEFTEKVRKLSNARNAEQC